MDGCCVVGVGWSESFRVLFCCGPHSAKVLVPGEPNVAYICSRYYRAPELIFGATQYTCSIGKAWEG